MRQPKKVYGFTTYEGYRIIGKAFIKDFIRTISNKFRYSSPYWIRKFICETPNKEEIKMANENLGYLLLIRNNLGYGTKREIYKKWKVVKC